MALAAYSVLSSVTNSFLSPSFADSRFLSARLSRHHLRKFSTSNGCQDHTASPYVSAPFVLRALDRSRGSSRPATPSAPDAAASTASRPSVRDDGQRPSLGQD